MIVSFVKYPTRINNIKKNLKKNYRSIVESFFSDSLFLASNNVFLEKTYFLVSFVQNPSNINKKQKKAFNQEKFPGKIFSKNNSVVDY